MTKCFTMAKVVGWSCMVTSQGSRYAGKALHYESSTWRILTSLKFIESNIKQFKRNDYLGKLYFSLHDCLCVQGFAEYHLLWTLKLGWILTSIYGCTNNINI